MFKYNFTVVLMRIQEDFEGMSLVPLSVASRISLVKMNVLPKFYPNFILKSFIRKLDGIVLGFVWNKKPLRIS